jgi:hypothetical protein
MFYLYRITLQKYSYIGVSKSPVRRWGQHSRAATTLGRAIRQCGRDNVIFQIIATGDRETIYALERAEIFAQKTRFPGGYNIAEGGFGGRAPLPSTKAKISAAMAATARTINRLNARAVATIRKHGRHADGGNLYLSVSPNGGRRRVFLYRWHGKQTEIGFGSARDVPLARARELATQGRANLAESINLRDARKPSGAATFGVCADRVIEARSQRPATPLHFNGIILPTAFFTVAPYSAIE